MLARTDVSSLKFNITGPKSADLQVGQTTAYLKLPLLRESQCTLP